MIIHEEILPLSHKETYLDVSNSVPVKYHVREGLVENQIQHNSIMTSSESENGEKKKKSDKKSHEKSPVSTLEETDNVQVTQISENDLEELRSVYKKCKAVMKKIESKYGHLLNLQELEGRKRKKKPSDSENIDLNKCECPTNKKIVFDDDGKEITTETELGNHICVKKLKRTRSTDHVAINNVKVEYEPEELSLPDDLQSLSDILHDPDIDITYRDKVIHKFRMLKQEYQDEIRFNKHMLIEKIKLNPDEFLDFKGTNLKTIPGYVAS